MATATYVQKGYQIDYTPAEGVAWGQVIPFADCIGVAAETIIAGETGAVSLVGVYEMPAASGVEIKTGEKVYWNKTNSNIDKTAEGGVPAGLCVMDKAASGTVAVIKIG